MRGPEIIGILTTFGIIIILLAVVSLQEIGSDVKLYGSDKCGKGVFYHKNTNSCEKNPPEMVWVLTKENDEIKIFHKSDGTWKTMDQIMKEQKDEFNP